MAIRRRRGALGDVDACIDMGWGPTSGYRHLPEFTVDEHRLRDAMASATYMLRNRIIVVNAKTTRRIVFPGLPADLKKVIIWSKHVKIGVPKEIKTHEYRVGMTPAGVRELVQHGHQVVVEHAAGTGIGYDDDAYRKAGATVLDTMAQVFATADLIVKVKEPQPSEIALLRRGQVLFTYLHLAADKAQTSGLMQSGATCIAYETVTDRAGALPLLAPMSEVAGRMAVQVGAHCLEREQGGAGILLGGVPGVPPAKVVVLGGGVSGTNAARMAVGLEASVTIIDKSLTRLKELDLQFGPRATTLFATTEAIEHAVLAADLVIGAVLVPGAAAPKLVTRDMVRRMRPGSVLVDIAIDQGGCFETSRPTTHSDPTYVEDGVVHYCVTNMPGAVARTSTHALTNATLPFVLALAGKGWRQAMLDDPHLAEGLNIHDAQVTHIAVAQALDLPHTHVQAVLVA
jgi:alanine dehydrogenase